MGHKITILGNEYKSKKDATIAFKGFLGDIMKNTSSEHVYQFEEEYGFIYDLFSRHENFSNKVNGDILRFKIKRNHHDSFDILYFDKDRVDKSFSWNRCITGRHHEKIEQVMRRSVQAQTLGYLLSNPICEICTGENNLHVHHLHLSFKVIKKKFIDDNGAPPFSTEVSSHWKRFHKQHAKLMTVCKKCHDSLHSKKSSV